MRKVLSRLIPGWRAAAAAVVSAVLLVAAFPDLGFGHLAWIALVPLFWAIERESLRPGAAFVSGWLFGAVFFFGSCWWLTFAPIHYAGFPPWIAYALMLVVAISVGIFPAIFAGTSAILIRRFGPRALLAAPFVWVFSEFLRYWVTGNDWNAIGYSQFEAASILGYAAIGGVLAVSFAVLVLNLAALALLKLLIDLAIKARGSSRSISAGPTIWLPIAAALLILAIGMLLRAPNRTQNADVAAKVVAVQPNVPMTYIDLSTLGILRERQTDLARAEIRKIRDADRQTTILVVLPESPMDYMYSDDPEFQQFIGGFAQRNNVSVLFNSAEPDKGTTKYFNSAVMVGPDGREAAQYDKIFLLPFGEAVPAPLEGIVPGFVGNFAYGREYDLLNVGDLKAGVMICFESHFGQLSRRYVADGADFLIEMTNDGYLGPTPVLRQHLANAVFRAVETGRPVLRATNVGVTAYITKNGEVIDPAETYAEATRVWDVSKSDGRQTFYVKFGDWLAWLSTIITLALAFIALRRRHTDQVSV